MHPRTDRHPVARRFPEGVPTLVDAEAGVSLRATTEEDLEAIVEECNDPQMIEWTTLPAYEGGYGLAQAREFLIANAAGWETGSTLTWAIEAERPDRRSLREPDRPGPDQAGRRRFCGNIDLRISVDGSAEVGYVLHPAARGRGLMTSALGLVRDYAFDVAGVNVLRWRALVGNWPSRRTATRAGFTFDGAVRRLLNQRGTLRDGWVATMLADDPRTPRPWLTPEVIAGDGVRLRPFEERDVARIVESGCDPRIQHWIASAPYPYTESNARAYLEATRELAAQGTGLHWCVADPADDRCLGSIGLEGLHGYAPRAEIGYWAHPDARGRGVTTRAVRLLTAHALGSGLASAVLIRCAAGNTASRHVAESAGYVCVGVVPGCEPVRDSPLDDLVIYRNP